MFRIAPKAEERIEFVGGPFDGHWHSYFSAVARLPADVVWLVSINAFRKLEHPGGMMLSPGNVLSSAALYELDVTATMLKYRHAGSISAQGFGDTIRKCD